MNVIINLGNKDSSVEVIERFASHDYVPLDVQIDNSHIKELNELVGMNIFSKASLYIGSTTIHDLMQPIGGKGQHNYHELTADDIYMALTNIKNPNCVFITKDGRYALISIELSHFNQPLMLVVEKGAGLINDPNANINKVITIYPRRNVDEYIEKIDKRCLLYKK